MQDYLSALTPQYWPFWIGLLLVVDRAGRPRAHHVVDDAGPPLAARLDWRARAVPPPSDGEVR